MKVKFLAKTPPDQDPALWTSLFAGGIPKIGAIEFTFDIDARDYDFLAVYEGLPPLAGEKKVNRIEYLSCPHENTLLITTEPSSIRLDGPHFLSQFGHILTAKDPALVRHKGQIQQTPPLRWFYGRPMGFCAGEGNSQTYMSFDAIASQTPPHKPKTLSTVCSTKQMAHTGHAKRYEFVMALKSKLDDLEIFGRGINPVNEKSEAMVDYRYHIAIENHYETGHWTEKLSDCFLAHCLPFYFGDPNYAKVFPKNAVIPIDIYNLDAAERIIRAAIKQDAYSSRLPDIIKAREIVLTKQNLMIIIANIAAMKTATKAEQRAIPHSVNGTKNHGRICGRHIYRKLHPFKASSDALFRAKMRHHPKASPLQYSV